MLASKQVTIWRSLNYERKIQWSDYSLWKIHEINQSPLSWKSLRTWKNWTKRTTLRSNENKNNLTYERRSSSYEKALANGNLQTLSYDSQKPQTHIQITQRRPLNYDNSPNNFQQNHTGQSNWDSGIDDLMDNSKSISTNTSIPRSNDSKLKQGKFLIAISNIKKNNFIFYSLMNS